MEQTSLRYCRKCLLQDMEESELWENLRGHIARIPPERRVPEPVLEHRLSLCRQCDQLINGMCRLCGCYVEMRAVMRIRSCPHVPAKWLEEEEEND